MTLRLLGPHDLRPGFTPPPSTAIKGHVGLVKNLLDNAPLSFQLVIHAPSDPISKGPHKKALVSIITGLKNGGNHARPLRDAERALRRAMKENVKIVLHTGVKGYEVVKSTTNIEKKRKEVDLKLGNGSRLQVMGSTGEMGEIIDFYSESTVQERDWFSSPSPSQEIPPIPLQAPQSELLSDQAQGGTKTKTIPLTELPIPQPQVRPSVSVLPQQAGASTNTSTGRLPVPTEVRNRSAEGRSRIPVMTSTVPSGPRRDGASTNEKKRRRDDSGSRGEMLPPPVPTGRPGWAATTAPASKPTSGLSTSKNAASKSGEVQPVGPNEKKRRREDSTSGREMPPPPAPPATKVAAVSPAAAAPLEVRQGTADGKKRRREETGVAPISVVKPTRAVEEIPPPLGPKVVHTRTDPVGTASMSKGPVSGTEKGATTVTVKATSTVQNIAVATSKIEPIPSDGAASISSKTVKSTQTVTSAPIDTPAAPAPKPKDPPAKLLEPVKPTTTPTRIDPDKHIAKRLKSQKIAERRRSRALEQAGLAGGMTPGDREAKEKKIREEIDAIYKRGLGKATVLEIEYKYNLILKKLTYWNLDRWINSGRDVGRGERGDTIGVIRGYSFVPSSHPKVDHRYDFQLQDPSLDSDDFFMLSVFANTRLEIPSELLRGSVLLIRDFWVTRGGGGRERCSGKTMSKSGFQWACLELKPDGSTIEHVGTGRNALRYPEICDRERHAMARLKDWWIYVARPEGLPGNAMLGGPETSQIYNGKQEKRVTVNEIAPGGFYDLVVEVVHVFSMNKSGILDLHVTDYTSNKDIEDGERSLAHHPHLKGRKILEATFWDENAAEAQVQDLQEGQFVLLRNAHCEHKMGTLKVNIRSSVRGKKGTYDVGQSWKRLNITHPLVVEVLSRKEDLEQKGPSPDEPTPKEPAPVPASAESEWSETMNAMIRTSHIRQNYSTIQEILQNTSVPNRFRLKARASAIRHVGKKGEMVIKWCKTCNKSFAKEYCRSCNDRDLDNAEYRYRFWAILQDESNGPKLPCQMEHRCIKNLLHTLPAIKTDPEVLVPLFVQASTKIRVSLWDHKVDGAFPMNLVDWSIESYSVEHPLVPEQMVTMYRVFDMTVV